MYGNLDQGSPPLTRGIQLFKRSGVPFEGITPAYAGNTPQLSRSARAVKDHPRLRGEYRGGRLERDPIAGSPPLTRGIPLDVPMSFATGGITPAYAGNTSHCRRWSVTSWDHPRLRGEYNPKGILYKNGLGSPPLTRGIPSIRRSRMGTIGITPAYAGNTLKESLIYSIFPLSATKFHLVSHTLEMS